MNKDKTLDLIARRQRDILALTERLYDAGHEETMTNVGVGSAVVVLIGKQLDPFALATEQAWINVAGETVPIPESLARSVRETVQAIVVAGLAQCAVDEAEGPMRRMIDD